MRKPFRILLIILPIAILATLFGRSVYHHAGQYDRDRELYQAVANGNVGKVRALLQQGADPDICSDPPARRTGLMATIRQVLHPVHDPGTGPSALHVAAAAGNDPIVDILLKAGANCRTRAKIGICPNPFAQEDMFGTPLAAAANKGHGRTVSRLLSAGADPNDATTDGSGSPRMPIIWLAAVNCDAATVHDLFVHGAILELHPVGTELAASFVAHSKDPATVALFVGHGMDVNAKDLNRSLLWYAIWCDHVLVVRLLLDHGADITARDSEGLTPLQFAQRKEVHPPYSSASLRENKRRDEIIKLLKAHGAK